jgi:hypothetical protein
MVCYLFAGEEDLYPAAMAAGQDRRTEKLCFGQLICIDPDVGVLSGRLAQGDALR